MKIGEFAKYCGTKISVLRHYDREKILIPERIDTFTGYRYYSPLQKTIFDRINALKNAGFTLHEIRRIISFSANEEEITQMFARKADELNNAIRFLKEAEYIMSELNVIFEKDKAKIRVMHCDDIENLCRQLDSYIKNADCQRISQFSVNENEISCRVVKLGDETESEDPIMPFIDDKQVIGKWEVIGNYAVREDFDEDLFSTMSFYGEDVKYIYFLPNGTKYWCFCWTKGYFVVDGYRINPIYNPYELVKKGDETFMLIKLRENEAMRGGQPTILALRQVDNHEYTPEMIAKKDDIDKPFVNDERIVGKWRAHSFLCNKSEFPEDEEDIEDLYFKEIEFFPGGECRCVYEDDVFEGNEKVCWTKDYLLRKWNWSACEYEIRTHNNKEYLIIEWKSGDYRFGGFDTNYYVFVRA
ncbi:MAG: MerR family transcriptional regulator [Clostridia bacterium]|nr:MerR family transcriptional regulator [Clostridia bacterium]